MTEWPVTKIIHLGTIINTKYTFNTYPLGKSGNNQLKTHEAGPPKEENALRQGHHLY